MSQIIKRRRGEKKERKRRTKRREKRRGKDEGGDHLRRTTVRPVSSRRCVVLGKVSPSRILSTKRGNSRG